MTNDELAERFYELGDLLRIDGSDRNRARAFRRTGEILKTLREPVRELLKYGRLESVKGIGPGSLERIKELIRTGTTVDLERLRARYPTTLRTLLDVHGLGPSTVRELWRTLGVATLPQLAWAANSGQLERVPGIGAISAEQIRHELAQRAHEASRILLPDAIALAERVIAELSLSPHVLRVMPTGSVRRHQETIGDVDFVCAATDRPAVSARFATLTGVQEVLMQARTRASVRFEGNRQADIWIVPPECWGAGLHAFSGNREHVVAIRKRAGERGIALSEDGIFERTSRARISPGTDEAEVFRAVGLPFIVPELRQNTGEIEAADRGRLPNVIDVDALRGELSLHSQAGEGEASARQMVMAAAAAGCSYVAVVDVPRRLKTPDDWRQRKAELRALEDELGVGVLVGARVEITTDGELALAGAVLDELDLVVGQVTTELQASGEALTERVVTALASGRLDVLAHPTGRVVLGRPPLPLDLEAVMKEARRSDVAMQLNADPSRLDLDEKGCRLAREMGVPVSVDSDARAPEEIERRRYGVWTARRGWLTNKHVLNARSFSEVQDFLALRRGGRPGRARALPAPRAQSAAALPPAVLEPQIMSLEEQLRVADLDEDLAERIERYLKDGGDPPLERALGKVSGNPLQKAFELVMKARERGLLA